MTRYRIGVFKDEDFVPTGCHGKPLPEPPEVYAAVVVERLDDDAVEWVTVDSLWGIDLMVDSPEAVAVSDTGTRWYRVTDLPPGYLGDVARELLAGVLRRGR